MNQPGDPNFDQGSQTNPFTADLKGEFGSNFGTGTNAVSQIFKEGGFASDQRTRTLIGVAAVVFVGVLGYFVLGGGEEPYGAYVEDEELTDENFEDEDDDFGNEQPESNLANSENEKDDTNEINKAENNTDNDNNFDDNFDNNELSNENYNTDNNVGSTGGGAVRWSGQPSISSLGTAAPSLISPEDGLLRQYDDSASHPEITWSGGGGRIAFSRSADMSVVEVEERVQDGSHRSRQLSPGTWYWRVENRFGVSDIRSFTLYPPESRNTVLGQPQEGGTLAGTGGVVTWTGSSRVAYYRVELSSGSWATPQYRFSTAGTQLNVEGVSPGQYQLRVGAFSEVSGRFEYTNPVQVTVQ